VEVDGSRRARTAGGLRQPELDTHAQRFGLTGADAADVSTLADVDRREQRQL
jgi:hypothetical protein